MLSLALIVSRRPRNVAERWPACSMSATRFTFEDRTCETGAAALTAMASAAALRFGVPRTAAAIAATAMLRVRFAISLPPRYRRRERAPKTGIRQMASEIRGNQRRGCDAGLQCAHPHHDHE